MAQAVQIESLQLRRLNHISNRDLRCGTRQHVAASRAASAFDHTGSAQTQENLFDIIGRETLDCGQLTTSHRAFSTALRQMQ
jgi:hypothetical protein